MSEAPLIAGVERYYSSKLEEHGPTPEGVDWNGARGQELRFDQLLAIVGDGAEPFSIVDYGCGYGALLDRLAEQFRSFAYTGYDIAPSMVEEARRRYEGTSQAAFTSDAAELRPADFTVASGVLNVKLDVPVEAWRAHVLDTIGHMASLSTRGFAFNALTSHADPDRKRPDLFYSDPAELLDHCLRTYSRDVALRHDYELYEFTLLVRLDGRGPAAAESL